MKNNVGRPAGEYGKPYQKHTSQIIKNRIAEKQPMAIESDLYRSLQLTSSEKWVMASIMSLSEDGICYATNKQIGDNIGLTSGNIGQKVVHLTEKGYIEKESYCTKVNPDTGGNKVRRIKIIKT